MALSPKDRWPGNTVPGDPEYPFGRARNESVPGDKTGTPWEKDLINDIWGFQQSLLAAASIIPNGDPDKVGASQYLQALERLFPLRTDGFLLKNITVIDSAGAGVYNTPAWTRALLIFAIGGGGAGGGAAATGAGQVSGGSGGTAGSVCAKWVTSPDASYPYTVGAGGTGVSGAAGNNGGSTTIAGMTAGFGGGGSSSPAQTPPRAVSGGGHGVSSGYTFALFSGIGEMNVMLQATPGNFGAAGGLGGRNAFTRGTLAEFGRGGSGVRNAENEPAAAGLNGADGAIVIFEFG